MHAQCEQLLRLAELPNLTLRVMPLPHGAHLGMNSAFAVLGFPEADDPDIAYIGHIAGSAQVEKLTRCDLQTRLRSIADRSARPSRVDRADRGLVAQVVERSGAMFPLPCGPVRRTVGHKTS